MKGMIQLTTGVHFNVQSSAAVAAKGEKGECVKL
jgi:hypothetical protein